MKQLMKQRRLTTVAMVILLLMVSASMASAAPAQTIDWWVMAGGGGTAAAGGVTLNVTIGQALAGVNAAGGSDLCAGFWCGASANPLKVYLPAIQR